MTTMTSGDSRWISARAPEGTEPLGGTRSRGPAGDEGRGAQGVGKCSPLARGRHRPGWRRSPRRCRAPSWPRPRSRTVRPGEAVVRTPPQPPSRWPTRERRRSATPLRRRRRPTAAPPGRAGRRGHSGGAACGGRSAEEGGHDGGGAQGQAREHRYPGVRGAGAPRRRTGRLRVVQASSRRPHARVPADPRAGGHAVVTGFSSWCRGATRCWRRRPCHRRR